MRKFLVAILSAAAVFSFVAMTPSAVIAADKVDLAISGGSIGGAWAAIGEGVGEVVRRSYPGSNTAYEVGQEAANLMLVSRGKVQLGIAHAQFIKMASEGKPPFKAKLENLRALCILYHDVMNHFIVKTDTGIASFADLKAKQYPLKAYFNTKDSFMDIVGQKVIEAEGLTQADIEKWGGFIKNSSMGAALDLMRDGKIDAYSNVIQIPSSHIVDAGTTLNLTLLGMTPEAQEKVNAELGTYSAVIPQSAYGFLEGDVPTVAASVVLFCNTDLPENEAYMILKSIYENFDYFRSIHGSLKDMTLETMEDVSPLELHPGAVKFFEEYKAK